MSEQSEEEKSKIINNYRLGSNMGILRDFYEWLGRDFELHKSDIQAYYSLKTTEEITLSVICGFACEAQAWFEQKQYWGENDNLLDGDHRALKFLGYDKVRHSKFCYPEIKFSPFSYLRGWRVPYIKITHQPIRDFFLDRLYNF